MKIDFKKTMKPFYNPKPKQFEIIEIPKQNFLKIEGIGAPGTSETYLQSVQALYPIAYKLKFLSKANDKDYVVPSLEGLWWADDMDDYVADNRDNWRWILMIMVPEWLTANDVEKATNLVRNQKDKKKVPDLIDQVYFEAYDEGEVVQYMHIGAYADEAPYIQKMHHEIAPEQGYEIHGLHHEIYLSDPRKVAPEKLKTVLRQPIKKL